MIARFGRYEAIEVLGRGGMGIVYRGVDTMIGRTVAVKTVLLDEAGRGRAGELHERLIREVKAAGTLQHPNIITIHDVGVENGTPYSVMELIQGRGLDRVLEEGTPPVEESLRILRDTARALDFAHARGVIHRDIKPGNILIAIDGTVKLADFGIAKVAGTTTLTETGAVMGSVPFMAPEAWRGETLSASSDQFSLTVMAYSMMTGRMPFQAETMASLIAAILHTQPRAAREINPSLPPGVDAVLAHGLAKSATARYESCTAFVEALRQAFRAAPPSPLPPPRIVQDLPPTGPMPAPNRSRWVVVAAGLALAGMAVAGWLILTRPGAPPDAVARAPVEERKPASRGTDEPSAPTNKRASESVQADPPAQPPAEVEDRGPSPKVAPGTIREHPRDGLKYVFIPPGRFRMGCSDGDTECSEDEKPARDVELTRGFWIGQTEVTQAAYQKVKRTNPSQFKGATLPVETVTWDLDPA